MADEVTPPVAPVVPEPVAPVVPEPVAPVVPAPVAPTAEEAAEAAEAKEWDDAASELFPGIKSTQKPEEKKPDEQAKPEKTAEEIAAETAAAKDKKPDAAAGASNDAGAKGKDGGEAGADADEEAEAPDTTARDARLAARQTAQVAETVRADVVKQMFADAPTELHDADGDPIKSIDDVMRLKNPRTGVAFTEEEAGMWLLSAQQKFNDQVKAREATIDKITEVNMDIKDQADVVAFEYGALLKEMPELRDQLWAEYLKSLKTDPKTGIITEAPFSLENFYRIALKPYVDLANTLPDEEAPAVGADGKPVPPVVDEAKAKADAEEAKKKKLADRGDLYGGGKGDDMDPEEKEWAEAATAVFGPRK